MTMKNLNIIERESSKQKRESYTKRREEKRREPRTTLDG